MSKTSTALSLRRLERESCMKLNVNAELFKVLSNFVKDVIPIVSPPFCDLHNIVILIQTTIFPQV